MTQKKIMLAKELISDINDKLAEESDAKIKAEDITPQMSLRDDLDMDSMQAVSLSLDVEDLLDIVLDGDEIASMETVGDLYQLIEDKLEDRKPVT